LGGFKVFRAICKTPIFFNERPQPTFRDWLARCDQRETQDFRRRRIAALGFIAQMSRVAEFLELTDGVIGDR
jgi:hypothetical protein